MKKGSSSKQSQKRTAKAKRTQESVTIGMDLGDRSSRYCMLSGEGEILREDQVPTTKAGMTATFGSLGRARIAIEVGTHSPWVSRLLGSLGHEVVVAPRQVKLITESSRKDDRLDARTLARLARIDPQLLRPIQHRSEKALRRRRRISGISHHSRRAAKRAAPAGNISRTLDLICSCQKNVDSAGLLMEVADYENAFPGRASAVCEVGARSELDNVRQDRGCSSASHRVWGSAP